MSADFLLYRDDTLIGGGIDGLDVGETAADQTQTGLALYGIE